MLSICLYPSWTCLSHCSSSAKNSRKASISAWVSFRVSGGVSAQWASSGASGKDGRVPPDIKTALHFPTLGTEQPEDQMQGGNRRMPTWSKMKRAESLKFRWQQIRKRTVGNRLFVLKNR